MLRPPHWRPFAFLALHSRQASSMTNHAVLTRREAATRARISLRLLDKLIAAGTGPTVTRIAGRVLIREQHLAEWLDGCAQAAG